MSPSTFEEKIARLEEVNALLRSGERPLSELLALYEEGIRLYREARVQLDEAKMQIDRISEEYGIGQEVSR
ncbi:MAG: exodeoxyribonuclease VII small subunit [Bacillota bacterium]|nr:exodeoxyribonuclease VII small subunit [Bacillota bacterium]